MNNGSNGLSHWRPLTALHDLVFVEVKTVTANAGDGCWLAKLVELVPQIAVSGEDLRHLGEMCPNLSLSLMSRKKKNVARPFVEVDQRDCRIFIAYASASSFAFWVFAGMFIFPILASNPFQFFLTAILIFNWRSIGRSPAITQRATYGVVRYALVIENRADRCACWRILKRGDLYRSAHSPAASHNVVKYASENFQLGAEVESPVCSR